MNRQNAVEGVDAVRLIGVAKSTKGPDMMAVEADGTHWAHMPKGRWEADSCDACGGDAGGRCSCWVSRKGAVRCEAHGIRRVVAHVAGAAA